MYTMRFWFEHGGGCLWSMDPDTNKRFGYRVHYERLPLSENLINCLQTLEQRYQTYLDMSDPGSGSCWSAKEKQQFLAKANATYIALCDELGDAYTITNEAAFSVGEE